MQLSCALAAFKYKPNGVVIYKSDWDDNGILSTACSRRGKHLERTIVVRYRGTWRDACRSQTC